MTDLAAAGVIVKDVWDLVNTAAPYSQAFPVLIDHLSRSYEDSTLEGIVRALAVKDARPLAWDQLIVQVKSRRFPKRVADAAMAALSAMARPSDLPSVLALIANKSLGSSRVFLVHNLKRSKSPEAREVLLNLRDDPDLRKEISARLKSPV